MASRGSRPTGVEQARAELSSRLADRRVEIERALLERIQAIADPPEAVDSEYVVGLRASVTAALDYALAALQLGEERAPQVPPILLAQSRLAARNDVGLDTVLRRYLAGYGLLSEMIVDETENCGIAGDSALRLMLRGQATLFDRLIAAVSDEHRRALAARPNSSKQRRVERIERLLAGELIDTSGFSYDFAGNHLGLIVKGDGGDGLLRQLADSFGHRLLLVPCEDHLLWAWLGGRRRPDVSAVARAIRSSLAGKMPVALGEPAQGLRGWGLTHRQARAALPIASQGPRGLVRYCEVALLSCVLRDDVFATTLRRTYLAPLATQRDGGEAARATLRAYFEANRNVTSTAATLRISRHTVSNRLQEVEALLGSSLGTCANELETALCLQRHDKLSSANSTLTPI